MGFIYDLIMRLVWIVLRIVSIRNSKLNSFVKGRKSNLESDLKNPIWIHCASVGEFEQGRPLIEKIKREYPEEKILLTFFSPSGFDHLKNYPLADAVIYSPFDISSEVKKFLEHYEPKALLLIKYEFWKNLIFHTRKADIPIYSISSIFRKNQRFFKWYGGTFKNDLKQVDHFFLQNETSKELLNSIGITNITVSGDTRFDRVIDIAEGGTHIDSIKEFAKSPCLIAGSTWIKDEEFLLSAFQKFEPEWKLIIAPHEVNSNRITEITSIFSEFPVVSFSGATNEELSNARILIIDSLGILNRVYRYGKICYIGGAFGAGLHNILEAAVWGKPIIHGPNFSKFQEAIDLAALGGSISVVNDTSELVHLHSNSKRQSDMGLISEAFIYKNKGASQQVLSFLNTRGIF